MTIKKTLVFIWMLLSSAMATAGVMYEWKTAYTPPGHYGYPIQGSVDADMNVSFYGISIYPPMNYPDPEWAPPGWTLVFDVSLASTSNGSLLTGFISVDTFEDTIHMFSDMNGLWTVALFASDRWPASSCYDCGITGYWQAVNDSSEQIPEPATSALLSLGLGLLTLVATRGRSIACPPLSGSTLPLLISSIRSVLPHSRNARQVESNVMMNRSLTG